MRVCLFLQDTRDLFRMLLDKCSAINGSDNVSISRCLDVIHDVIAYVLDRNSCLMPSYFALNEIDKLSNKEGKPWPHWVSSAILVLIAIFSNILN